MKIEAELDAFGIIETTDPMAKGLRFTGTEGQEAVFIVGPDGLEELIAQLNGLALHWASAGPQRKKPAGPTRALTADLVSLARGRHDNEVAMTVHIGPMRFQYLLPRDRAAAAFPGLGPGQKTEH